MAAPELSEILAQLRRINQRIDALPAQIAASVQKDRSPLKRSDRMAMAHLLRALLVVDRPTMTFDVGDVLHLIHVNPDVQSSLCVAVGAINRTANLRIGKLLARCEGYLFDDLHLSRAGEDNAGVIWRISRVVR